MTRQVFVLISNTIRQKVRNLIADLPQGWRIELKAPKRTLPQNDRMWAMLTDVSEQLTHCGRKYPPEIWKCLFMHELGRQCEFVPALDGSTVIPLGFRSSDLTVDEMGQLMECIEAHGVQNGVEFHTNRKAA